MSKRGLSYKWRIVAITFVCAIRKRQHPNFRECDLSETIASVAQSGVVQYRQCGCRLVSKQAAVASVVFVDVQTMLLDNLDSSSQCCCDGRIANVWQRLDENFLDFFQCEAVIEPGPHVDGEFMGLTHGNHDGHRNQAAGAPVQTGTSPDVRKDLVDRVGSDRGSEGF